MTGFTEIQNPPDVTTFVLEFPFFLEWRGHVFRPDKLVVLAANYLPMQKAIRSYNLLYTGNP